MRWIIDGLIVLLVSFLWHKVIDLKYQNYLLTIAGENCIYKSKSMRKTPSSWVIVNSFYKTTWIKESTASELQLNKNGFTSGGAVLRSRLVDERCRFRFPVALIDLAFALHTKNINCRPNGAVVREAGCCTWGSGLESRVSAWMSSCPSLAPPVAELTNW